MSSMAVVVGLIGAIVFLMLLLAGFAPIFGSLHEDSVAANVSNSSINGTYQQGVAVATGFMGFNEAVIAILIIVLIICIILLIFSL
jgi:hypothetical protein